MTILKNQKVEKITRREKILFDIALLTESNKKRRAQIKDANAVIVSLKKKLKKNHGSKL